jgi:DegV family protein with EDD domain
MEAISIVTDSSCDLPPAVLAQHAVTVVPLVVRFGEKVFLDTELSREQFWRLAEQAPPFTSGAPIGGYVAAFQRLVEQGSRVLCLCLTARHSNVVSTAWSAAREFGDRVAIFDSQSLSYGLGYQVIAAAQAAAKGLPLEQVIAAAKSVRSRVHIQILLDTVSFVRRGGRADHFIGLIDRAARTLSIKPILTFSAGEMRLLNLSRTCERGLKRMLAEVSARAPLEELVVGHTFRQERAEQFADELAAATGFPRQMIHVFETGSAIASHSGPGLVAAVAVSKA